ncbi:MAG: glutathione S-transferase family protein [Betaproteobacteria bacterium]|nr:glutathione S-transferase family protein [Betaproteobacteria bacterium]
MTITFYYGSGSPYAWRVWLGLEHKQLPYEQKVLSFSDGDQLKPEFLRLNPRHKVPVIDDEGLVLYESVAILEYLDERYPDRGGRLYPAELRRRALVRRLVQEVDHYLAKAMDPLLREVLFKPEAEQDAARIAKGREKLAEELARFEGEIRGDFLAGELSAADFALYPMLALALRVDLKRPEVNVAGLIGPRLRAWMQRVQALPYLEKTVPPHWKQ